MRRVVWALPVVLLLFWSTAADASPIVVNAGETLTFNFDFFASAVVPPPPYSSAEFNVGLDVSSLDAGDAGSWTGFDQLNGGGAVVFGPFNGVNLISTQNIALGDGVFSFVLSVTSGSITIDPYAVGYGDNFQPVTPHVAPLADASVPEPATLTLLGGGLALGALRRRRLAR